MSDFQAPAASRRARRRSQRRRTSVIGVLGEVLITTGVVVLLFIVWQQWFNDIVVAQGTRDQASKISEQLHDAAPPVGSNTVTFDSSKPKVTPKPADGVDFGVLYVPRFGSDYRVPLAGGTGTAQTLDKGDAGHYDSSQMPGAVGNFAIAGHRTTHGAPFANIAELKVGDHFYVQTKTGYYTYTFRNLQYVQPTQIQVLQQVPDAPKVDTTSGDRLITLTSCNPKFSAAERIIAYGVFDSWRPFSAGAPSEIKSLVKG
ncbi:class E sortase [Frondihabitans sp. VKM Ac-2883]|uniref:class E sortase n=1 Tax=Frondihabitans sp. VKM Ac-2883 TaxID=2783823 RepID=UPI00188D6F7F|nr:class E sortase [Frondihabitans sp. VKM Ac-2883]MBF4575146.1 class E sortase [Frondihabitans sp. VKM Ac-2883]